MREQEPYPPYLHDEEEKPRRIPIFDPTINLGHIISLAIIIFSAISIYISLDKRVLILEVTTSKQQERDAAQDMLQTKLTIEMKEAFSEVKKSTEKNLKR